VVKTKLVSRENGPPLPVFFCVGYYGASRQIFAADARGTTQFLSFAANRSIAGEFPHGWLTGTPLRVK
jgi:hypothetical protein